VLLLRICPLAATLTQAPIDFGELILIDPNTPPTKSHGKDKHGDKSDKHKPKTDKHEDKEDKHEDKEGKHKPKPNKHPKTPKKHPIVVRSTRREIVIVCIHLHPPEGAAARPAWQQLSVVWQQVVSDIKGYASI
jgi:hypothetical protein